MELPGFDFLGNTPTIVIYSLVIKILRGQHPNFKNLIEFADAMYAQPITEQETEEYLSVWGDRELFGTKLSMLQLRAINKDAFQPILEGLIKSKRIQRLTGTNGDLFYTSTMYLGNDDPIPKLAEIASLYKEQRQQIKEKYTPIYEEVEYNLRQLWGAARKAEPRFPAVQGGRRKRKTLVKRKRRRRATRR